MKKIAFSDKYGLEQAVIAGRKTMTRRAIPCKVCQDMLASLAYKNIDVSHDPMVLRHSQYKVGEVVAIAQRYESVYNFYKQLSESVAEEFKRKTENSFGWKNKMYVKAELMPFRIKIVGVCIQRLRKIIDMDCMREGILNHNSGNHRHKRAYPFYFAGGKHEWDNSFSTPRQAFASLIDKISGKGTWDSNPWVFAYTFELVR